MHMFFDIDARVEDIILTYVDENCKRGDRNKTGLDPRAFQGEFFYSEDCIVVTVGMNRSLRYYGGFEYIDDEFIRTYGDYVIYSAEHERVRDVIESLTEEEVDA